MISSPEIGSRKVRESNRTGGPKRIFSDGTEAPSSGPDYFQAAPCGSGPHCDVSALDSAAQKASLE